jgi:hypothetical protein
MKKAKPSKVIYVVNRPRPGHNKGDWTVRMHGKILSHHKLKGRAIKVARVQARKRNFTVMVQNADGSFAYGFHPVKK